MLKKLSVFAWLCYHLDLIQGLPLTEAEHRDFNLTGLKQLSKKRARQVSSLLKELQVLGPWHSNITFLLDLNKRLVEGGEPLIIDGFFDDAIFDGLQKSLHALADEGNLKADRKGKKPDIRKTGVDMKTLDAAVSPKQKCKILSDVPFQFRHHDWSFGEIKGKPSRYPALKEVLIAWKSEKWNRAWNSLLAGSGYRVKSDIQERMMPAQMPTLREWMPGDYSLLHNDHMPARVLSINIYLSTTDWQLDWGGNFLWCGSKPYANARRIRPASNSAALFLPHEETWHAVEAVKSSNGNSGRRWSITSFLKTAFSDDPQRDQHRHAAALQARQSELLSSKMIAVDEL
eukprot:TRINITY_DN27067_c0_g1_i1.p1 TRINITY_DN27067_c0_g1~~TRINITY_DN27067_c0_g1_i1.p1  ORF type:complete len:344 (+),score=58.28 TRINITY_DN27067_c0_g1_i1:75-1106(+)